MTKDNNFVLAIANNWQTHQPINRRWVRTALAACVVALCLSACGGSEDDSGQAVTDEDVAAAQDTVNTVLKASGLAQENEQGELELGFDKDGESARLGENLSVPEWLPKGFPLPSDLSIKLVTANLNDEKNLEGRSSSVTLADLSKQVTDWSTANGWELITANSERIITVNSGGDVIDIKAEDGVGMQLTMSKRSVAWDRQKAAVEVVSPGIATVTLADNSYTLNGECKIKGSTYGFEYYSPDGGISGTVMIQSADSEPTGSATLQVSNSSGFNQYTISFPTDSNEMPVITASGKEFSVSGQFGSMGSGGMQAVQGVYKVKCN
jgi:hypothetical protein